MHLWLTNPDEITDKGMLKRYEQLLGEDELVSYRELVKSGHRREYLISQAFLRDVLGYYTNISPSGFEFERNASGKPGLRHGTPELSDLHFNLSRSSGLMACAVCARGKIGVDVEALNPDSGMVDVADHYFSDAEVASLNLLPRGQQQERFCQIWTLKEAYIKARGEGLSLPLDSFSFDFDNHHHIRLREHSPERIRDDWQFWSLQPAPDRVTAVAVEATGCKLRVFSSIPLKDSHELALNDLGLVA